VKYLHLVWTALLRRTTRTSLTLLSVAMAFLLFGLLTSVRYAFLRAGQDVAAAHRLVTISRTSYMVGLPLSLYRQILTVPGVEAATYFNPFGGTYQGPKNPVGGNATVRSYFTLFPQCKVPPAQWRNYESTRTGLLAGASLAARYHWKVGDLIPIEAPEFPQRNGSTVWTFLVSGIDTCDPKYMENAIILHWRYFDSARASQNGTARVYLEKIADAREANRISLAIDALSANSDHETITQTSSAIAAAQVRQLGNISLIVHAIMGAVAFTIILLTGNTISQGVRERIPELAILKTIGFSGRNILLLVLAESVLLLALGGIAGLALADAVVGVVHMLKGPHLPMAPIAWAIWLRGLGIMVLVGLVVGLLPALRAMRLRVVDALAGW
jgi:putative ABC transport system permease protein